jgi:hypothetical protein
VGSRVGLGAVAKRKRPFYCPCQDSNRGRPVRSLVTVPTELPPLTRKKCEWKIFRYVTGFGSVDNVLHNISRS